jgi:hypothetical protein
MDGNNDPHIRHETTDVHVWAVGKFGVALALLCIASLGLLFAVFRYFQIRENTAEVKQIDPVRTFPQPQLQTTPALDLKAIRDAEDRMLATYGWVDREKGIVRIPIERAIDLLAQRGLPARQAPPAASAAKTPTESSHGGSQ